MGFSWEFQVGGGIALALILLLAFLGRRPSNSAPRSAHEWMVLRDRIQELESRVRALEQTPARTTVQPSPPVSTAISVPVPGRAISRPTTGLVPSAPVDSPARKTLVPLPTLIAVPDISQRLSIQPAPRPQADAGPIAMDEFGPQYERVCELAGKGNGSKAIAQELGLPLERVEMILGLYQLWAHPGQEPDPDMVHHVQAID